MGNSHQKCSFLGLKSKQSSKLQFSGYIVDFCMYWREFVCRLKGRENKILKSWGTIQKINKSLKKAENWVVSDNVTPVTHDVKEVYLRLGI